MNFLNSSALSMSVVYPSFFRPFLYCSSVIFFLLKSSVSSPLFLSLLSFSFASLFSFLLLGPLP